MMNVRNPVKINEPKKLNVFHKNKTIPPNEVRIGLKILIIRQSSKIWIAIVN